MLPTMRESALIVMLEVEVDMSTPATVVAARAPNEAELLVWLAAVP